MKKNILTEVSISCDPPSTRYHQCRTLEDEAVFYEKWVKDFEWFIHDHRSQDPVTLNVERDYTDVCSFCDLEWESEWDKEGPACCDEAIEEWELAKAVSK